MINNLENKKINKLRENKITNAGELEAGHRISGRIYEARIQG